MVIFGELRSRMDEFLGLGYELVRVNGEREKVGEGGRRYG